MCIFYINLIKPSIIKSCLNDWFLFNIRFEGKSRESIRELGAPSSFYGVYSQMTLGKEAISTHNFVENGS